MKKIITIILDGFGYSEDVKGNAVIEAEMNTYNSLWKDYPHTLLDASGTAVGLKEGQFGNSETGHQTIGAGRIVFQHQSLVDEFLQSEVKDNEVFQSIIKDKEKDIHLMGLCSDGGVHSNIKQILKLYEKLVQNGCTKIHFHLITDGRDTDTKSALKYIDMVNNYINNYKIGDISTICGRYYAMDRDKRWERTKEYYDLITKGIGINTSDVPSLIQRMYDSNITDEFLRPIVLNNSLIRNGDILIWGNYREDRAKQIISSFVNKDFDGFKVLDMSDLKVYSFLKIDTDIPTNYLINDDDVTNPLGVYLSKLGLSQARIAETEKFAHVTYFFDGGYLGKLPKCNEFLIESPKVSTYDLKPEMSAIPITKKAIECMKQDYDFILMNFANADMVGHTGDMDATVKACMAIDICLNKIMEYADENFYKVIITADHGNAECMIGENGEKITTHTTNKVPFIICDKQIELKDGGGLSNVAPTILDYMDIALPDEMKETESLLKK